jgi:hypothetical protein
MIMKPATLTEIVAGVRHPAGFQAAQAALDQLHARRAETHSALLSAIHGQPDRERLTGGASTGHIEQLGRDLADLDETIRAATLEWQAARVPFTAAVASALAPMRRSAIDAAVTAIGELVAALRRIDQVNVEITRAGGSAVRFPALYRNAVGALRARLQQQLPN